MHNVIINDKKYVAEDNSTLKETLTQAGFAFPCGGTGRCGKCRINCPTLPPTDLDRRFLNDNQIKDGVRLACDKKVTSSINIKCEISGANKTNIVLHECSVAVTISDEEIDVTIVGEEPVETVTINNPLAAYPTLSALLDKYKKDGKELTTLLRAAIGKESVELFEKYGGAKAQTTAVAGKGIYLDILAGIEIGSDNEKLSSVAENDPCGLPTESLYLLPHLNEYIGGEVIAECVKLKERSLLIDCERTVTFFDIGEKDDLAAAIWDCDYSYVMQRCIRSAALCLNKDRPKPTIYLCGKYADKAEEELFDTFTCIQIQRSNLSVVDALMSFRTRSKLNKEIARTTFVRLYDKEEFQKNLTE